MRARIGARRQAALAGAAVLVLAGCGGLGGEPGSGAGDDGGAPAGDLLAGHGLVMQADGEPAQLCLGAVAESYPPQCGGPELVGFDGWDLLPDRDAASGWTWGDAYVVGTYEGETFTLTEPASQEPPAGWVAPEPQDPEFPQLCEDPLAGSPGWDRTDPGAMAEWEAFHATLEGYDQLVLSYVSDGVELLNVLVAGDADAAHATFRESYAGPLCVAHSDLPLQRDVRAAQDAVAEAGLELLSAGSGVNGLLEVQVMVADEATVAAVQEVVSPWLSPDEVVVSGTLQPYPG